MNFLASQGRRLTQAGAAMRLEAGAAGISPRSAYHMISQSLLGAALARVAAATS